MCWAMGLVITKEEDVELSKLRIPWSATLALANDFFSFDSEYAELKQSGKKRLKNAVWLCMRWHSINVSAAKAMVRDAAFQYEQQFHELCRDYRKANAPLSEKLERYLLGLQYQVSGNIIWSLSCPRYWPMNRYDRRLCSEEPVLIKDGMTLGPIPRPGPKRSSPSRRTLANALPARTVNGIQTSSTPASQFGDVLSSSESDLSDDAESSDDEPEMEVVLKSELIDAPYKYVDAMPSKGVRDSMINALNVWFDVDAAELEKIRTIIRLLHTASLMLDDIQDGSALRRSKPAAHKVFGVAQTINSANSAMILAVQRAQGLAGDGAVDVVLDEIQKLHRGQGCDLYWTRHAICPTEEEYLQMVSCSQ